MASALIGRWAIMPGGDRRDKRKCRPGMGWRTPGSATGVSFVYAIQCGDFHKIGVSDDPDERCRSLQACNPYPLCVAARWRVPKGLREEIERLAHDLLHTRRARYEWFRVNLEEAQLAVDGAIELHARMRADPRLRQALKWPLDLLDDVLVEPSRPCPLSLTGRG
ncbi:GIY-YIG nuclease family protein [Methylobacterium sp. Leaf118]|uniref:GIY-YIG nuclease family protein n=1 Tax=Methylobacterium sp. Leaf118 TaxID=2876562 RepID=UPI001E493FEF|nr:GIY-YIG nuclease family protein [Methylobacterium sp. Leaf118]